MSYTKEDFYVGQRVRIRDTADMAAEYEIKQMPWGGTYAIDCPGLIFNIDGMSKFCGLTAEITTMGCILISETTSKDSAHGRSDNTIYVELDNLEDSSGNPVKDIDPEDWDWTIYMIEPIDEMEIKSGFDSALFDQMIGVIT